MTLELLEQAFSVCKLAEDSPVDLSMPLCFCTCCALLND